MDAAQLLRGLRHALWVEDKVPPGWYTLRELTSLWGISNAHAYRTIRKGLDAGIVEQSSFAYRHQKEDSTPHGITE